MSHKQSVAVLAALLLLTGGGLLLLWAGESPAPVTGALHPDARPLPAGTPSTLHAVGELRLGNPVVSMDMEHAVLHTRLSITVRLPELPEPVSGSVTVTGAPQLNASDKRFYLADPQMGAVELTGIPPASHDDVMAALATAIRQFAREEAVYAPMEANALKPRTVQVAIGH